jgi:hypothetical protein
MQTQRRWWSQEIFREKDDVIQFWFSYLAKNALRFAKVVYYQQIEISWKELRMHLSGRVFAGHAWGSRFNSQHCKKKKKPGILKCIQCSNMKLHLDTLGPSIQKVLSKYWMDRWVYLPVGGFCLALLSEVWYLRRCEWFLTKRTFYL